MYGSKLAGDKLSGVLALLFVVFVAVSSLIVAGVLAFFPV
jgi:hypothetical protein